jgi:hypothetical protein
MEMLWLFVVACGPVILGLLIAYALMTRRRRGPAERRATEEATARLYRDEHNRGAAKRG